MGLGAMTGVCLQGQTRRGSSAGSEDRTRGAGGRASLRAIGGGGGGGNHRGCELRAPRTVGEHSMCGQPRREAIRHGSPGGLIQRAVGKCGFCVQTGTTLQRREQASCGGRGGRPQGWGVGPGAVWGRSV